LRVVFNEVDQADQGEVTATSEISTWVSPLEANVLPQVIDQGEILLVLLADQVLSLEHHLEEHLQVVLMEGVLFRVGLYHLNSELFPEFRFAFI